MQGGGVTPWPVAHRVGGELTTDTQRTQRESRRDVRAGREAGVPRIELGLRHASNVLGARSHVSNGGVQADYNKRHSGARGSTWADTIQASYAVEMTKPDPFVRGGTQTGQRVCKLAELQRRGGRSKLIDLLAEEA